MPNKLSQFWQELKRRKVVRVITVYAAAAFVILELLSIIIEPLRLPDWTLQFAIVFLCIGFIIAVILSWIYDIHPEGGIVKTEPAHKVKEVDTWDSSNSWRIASYISFVVIVVLIVINIIPRRGLFNGRGSPDKSIVVLPLKNDSPEEEKMDFINGTYEHILDNLSKIENLRVISRTSAEKYRDNKKLITEIGEELNVGYVLEGSGQRDGGSVRITVQLLDAKKDMHIWSQTYHREIEDVFDMQSEVAHSATRDIESIIYPDADQIKKESTPERQTALIFYQKGLQEMSRYWESHYDRNVLELADYNFHSSIDYDSTFFEPYKQLYQVYEEKFWKRYGEQTVMIDSSQSLIDKVIRMGYQDSDTYFRKGRIHQYFGQYEEAIEALEDAISYDPENGQAIRDLARLYARTDEVKALKFLFDTLERGSPSAMIFRGISSRLRDCGFRELSHHYLDEALKLDGDSLYYFDKLAEIEFKLLDYHSAKDIGFKMHAIDSLESLHYGYIAMSYIFEHQYDSSLVYFRKVESLGWELSSRGLDLSTPRMFGFVLVQNGEVVEGERYINSSFEYYQDLLNRDQMSKNSYRTLGELYSYRGEKEKAIEHLRTFTQQDGINFSDIAWLKSPLLDNIRNEPEFKEIEQEVESIAQTKHERVRQWLEENDR